MKRENGSYNKTKKKALEVLEDKTWMDVPAFAHKLESGPFGGPTRIWLTWKIWGWLPEHSARAANCVFKSRIGAWRAWNGFVRSIALQRWKS